VASKSGDRARGAHNPESSVTLQHVRPTEPVPRIELVVRREAGVDSERRSIQDGTLCRIGSYPSNDLTLADPKVSRFHCQFERAESGWRITDSGSMNGTWVNDLRVRDADLPFPCRLLLGDSIVEVQELASASEQEVSLTSTFGAAAGNSVAMRRLFATLDRVAKTDSTVLLEGESGTGKEVLATELVRRGPRRHKPFVIVDCASISPSLIESELFGHRRGAFTGADRDRVGAFEAAHGGTVFLDEIGELPLDMQPKLLRTLESHQIRRIGDHRSIGLDVRVIAATNRRLEREVNHGRFRDDLYYRLSVVTLRIPPLRDRLDDIPLLVGVFLRQLGVHGGNQLFTPEVLSDMARYDWPGNVRELRNYVERAVVLDTVPPASTGAAPKAAGAAAGPAIDLDQSYRDAKAHVVADFEQRYVTALLSWSKGNISMAARKAGMDRMYLHRLVQRLGIKRGSSIED